MKKVGKNCDEISLSLEEQEHHHHHLVEEQADNSSSSCSLMDDSTVLALKSVNLEFDINNQDNELSTSSDIGWWERIPRRYIIVVLCFSAFLICNMDRVCKLSNSHSCCCFSPSPAPPFMPVNFVGYQELRVHSVLESLCSSRAPFWDMGASFVPTTHPVCITSMISDPLQEVLVSVQRDDEG